MRGSDSVGRDMSSFILQTLNGISYSALLFLVASGFTLTFGLMRIVNMAHGAYYLVGGYIGLMVARSTGSIWLAMLAGGAAGIVVGFVADRVFIRKAGEDHLSQVLITVGIAYIIGDVCLKIWGGDAQKLPLPVYLRGIVELPGGIVYPTFRIFLTLIGLVTAVALWLVYKKTYIGAAIRAGVDDREMVGATGIHIDRLFILISGLASFLAGVSGVLGGAFLTVYPGAEWEILVFALVVVIVGGLGSLEGAMIGALVVGLLDAYGRWLAPELSYFVLFGPMAVLLLFRPRGLFGTANMT
jgi:branched-chain amino acid transport system permease protein